MAEALRHLMDQHAFLRGMARVVVPRQCAAAPQRFESTQEALRADTAAIAQDWARVGNYIQSAMVKVSQEGLSVKQ